MPRKMMKRRVKKPTASLVRAVAKKVVADALEDKYARAEPQQGGQPVFLNSGITSPSDCYPIMPTIVQGSDKNQRIGDKIRPKSLVVQGYITSDGTLDTSMLQRVRLFIIEDKGIRNWQLSGSLQVGSDLLDNGGNKGQYSGLPNQETIRLNTDRYKKYVDRVYTLCKGEGLTPNAGGVGGSQMFVSNQQIHPFRFKIPTPAVLNYNTGSNLYPTNFAPFLCLGHSQPDGDITPDVNVTKVAMTYSAHLDYEDA